MEDAVEHLAGDVFVALGAKEALEGDVVAWVEVGGAHGCAGFWLAFKLRFVGRFFCCGFGRGQYEKQGARPKKPCSLLYLMKILPCIYLFKQSLDKRLQVSHVDLQELLFLKNR